MPKKITTIYELAEMTQREFVAIRGEIHSLRTDAKSALSAIVDSLDLIRQDLAETKRALSLLVRTIGSEMVELRGRIERIEKHIGLTK